MVRLLLTGLASGAIVVAVTQLASRWPRLAAVVLFVPMVPALALAAIYLKEGDASAPARLARQSLALIPLGLTVFVPVALAPWLKLGFWGAWGAGVALMTLAVGVYLWVAP